MIPNKNSLLKYCKLIKFHFCKVENHIKFSFICLQLSFRRVSACILSSSGKSFIYDIENYRFYMRYQSFCKFLSFKVTLIRVYGKTYVR